jgi:gliding motility-associated-like protein
MVTNKQCSEYKEIKIINNTPTLPLAGADKAICSENITLDGNIPTQGTGTWSVISGSATFTNRNTFNTEALGLLRGKNVLRWRITKDNCEYSDDVMITNDLPTQPIAGTGISVCGNTAYLNANKPVIGKGHWSRLSGSAKFVDSTIYNSRVYELGMGSNFLQWTIINTTTNNTCILSDIVEVKNNRTIVYAGTDQKIFENNTMLFGNEPSRGFGSWRLAAGAGDITSPYTSQTIVNNIGEGLNTFEWAVDIEGCISSDYVQVTYLKLPDASFALSKQSGCPPLIVQCTKTSNDMYPYRWELGNPDSISTQESPIVTFNTPGKYTVRLTVDGPDGKPVIKEKIIEVYSMPNIKYDLVPQKIYIPEGELRCYNTTSLGSTYLWDFGDGTSSDLMNPTHAYTDTGTYNVKLIVWTEHQCVDSLTVENGVEVIESSVIKFPSAFTPNMQGSSGGHYNRNDYSNDVFYPILIKGTIDNYRMEIFNRWGVQIFESNDINIGWDGYYKGKLMTENVYIYRVTGNYNSGKKLLITGDFLLMHR